ncbi:MAG: tRNA uridine-5-carboxymethylaminomethyl(34) synthesis GTPase MnmE [Pseudomonadota bacterium]
MSDDKTIYAPATAPGRAGLAILRLSGSKAGWALERLTGRVPPPARRASLRRISDPRNGEPIDQGLVTWFPGPASFTGEDMAELSLHGGRAVMAAVLEALAALPDFRLAEPGEFSRRAFLNGKLDLTEAEGLADLVAAETEAQRRLALRQLGGELGLLYRDWSEELTRALARLEAAIDFPEEDLPPGLIASVREQAGRIAGEIAAHLADEHRGERLREGLSIAILGPPNAGKSSLFNALAKRDAAIVSAVPGTTRDVLELALDLGGYPVVLADTAGLRPTQDEIEAEGVNRARRRGQEADLRLFVLDAERITEQLPNILTIKKDFDIVIANKMDLVKGRSPAALPCAVLPLSVRTGAGMTELLTRLKAAAAELMAVGASPVLTRARHRAAVEESLESLRRANEIKAPELMAEDLRLALRALGRITGKVDVDDILDRIFSEFCIGK